MFDEAVYIYLWKIIFQQHHNKTENRGCFGWFLNYWLPFWHDSFCVHTSQQKRSPKAPVAFDTPRTVWEITTFQRESRNEQRWSGQIQINYCTSSDSNKLLKSHDLQSSYELLAIGAFNTLLRCEKCRVLRVHISIDFLKVPLVYMSLKYAPP